MVILQTRKRAFTLIELLIVITIIGILAVALVPRLTGGPARARDATRKADLQQIAVGLEFYAADNGGYPDTTQCVSALTLPGMTTVPDDPSGLGADTVVIGACPTGYGYIALQPTSGGYAEGYLLIAVSESTTEVGDTGIYYNGAANSATETGVNATAAYNLDGSTGPGAVCDDLSSCTASMHRFYMIAH